MATTILDPDAGAVNRPTVKPRKSKKKPAPDAPAIRVELHPLPEPPDMAERLAKIYALAAKRYAEHHGEKAAG